MCVNVCPSDVPFTIELVEEEHDVQGVFMVRQVYLICAVDPVPIVDLAALRKNLSMNLGT